MSTYSELWNRLKPYAIPDMRAIGTSGGRNTSTGGVATMEAHVLATTSTLGTYHTVSGLTAGQVLKATGATDAAFGALAHTNLTGIGANDHHNQVHAITGADHTITASQYQVVGATATNTLGLLTPSADVSAGTTALLRSNAGTLTVGTLTAGTKVRAPLIDSSATLTLTPGTYAILSDGKKLRTSTYTTGFAGAGFQLDQGATITGQTYLELDNLTVRGILAVYELLVRQIRATNGSIFVSSTMKIASYNVHSGTEGTIGCYYRLYPDTEVSDNVFLVGDVIRAQRFSGTGTYRSDLVVTYVDPGNAYCIATAVTAQGPQVGFEYVRLGNTSNAARQGGLYMSGDDTGAPFLDVWDGVDAHADWNTAGVVKMRLGKLDGITSGTNEYGLWAAGANTGDYLRMSPTAGFELVAANGVVNIDETNGIALEATSAVGAVRSFQILRSGSEMTNLSAYFNANESWSLLQNVRNGASLDSILQLQARNTTYGDVDFILRVDASEAAGNNQQIVAAGDLFNLTGAMNLVLDSGDLNVGGDATVTGTLGVTGAVTFSGAGQYLTFSESSATYNGIRLNARVDNTWSKGIWFRDSSPADIGAWGAYGTADVLSYLWAGIAHSNNTLRVYPATDRVGIGPDVTPSYTLDVGGDSRVQDDLHMGTGGTDQNSIIHAGTGILYINNTDAADIKLKTNNTNRLIVQSTGEVLAESGFYVNGDAGAKSGYLGLTDVVNTTQSTGTLTIKLTGATSRNNTGFIKWYDASGNTVYIPYVTNIS